MRFKRISNFWYPFLKKPDRVDVDAEPNFLVDAYTDESGII